MVIDVVLYNGEYEMFELRYNILKDHVDKFIVVEFLETFSGKDKSSSLDAKGESRLKFSKVRHHVMSKGFHEDIPVPSEMYPNFAVEYAQREAMKHACKDCADDDIVYVGDVDEIWKPGAVKYLDDKVFKIQQIPYYYFLNNRWNRDWAGTFVGKWKTLKNISWNEARAGAGQRLDDPRSFKNLVLDGGWHFTNCMSPAEIRRKIESYSHQEYNTEEFKNDLIYKMADNRDYYGIKFPEFIDEESWPQYLKDNKEKYKHLCK